VDRSFLSLRQDSVHRWRQEAESGRLFAILDACDEPGVPPRMRALGPRRAVCLYRGRAEEQLWAIAPYLAECGPELFEWITANLWTRPWGILALSADDLDALQTHFRRFLQVTAPNGTALCFRFYDPRVLSRFAAIGSEEQWRQLLGPLVALAYPDPETYGVVRVTLGAPVAESAVGRVRLSVRSRGAERPS
jgi:hypothetical protein